MSVSVTAFCAANTAFCAVCAREFPLLAVLAGDFNELSGANPKGSLADAVPGAPNRDELSVADELDDVPEASELNV